VCVCVCFEHIVTPVRVGLQMFLDCTFICMDLCMRVLKS
jgi:hypothetical protein